MVQRWAAALGMCLVAGHGAGAVCPSGLDPYMDEPSPFGWPMAPNEWAYAHPECWADKYEVCGGGRQSPMDLDLQLSRADCAPTVAGRRGALVGRADYKILAGQPLVSISKYMRAAVVAGELGSLRLLDSQGREVEYVAVEAHLTASSLHTVNGTAASAELLVVHKPKGSLDGLSNSVILSVLFRQGATSSPLFSQMGFTDDDADAALSSNWKAPQSVDLKSLVKSAVQGTSYSYGGSVPVPPCSENVHYIVLEAEQSVGGLQVAKLRELLVKQTGGHQKRPPVLRAVEGGACRKIAANSLVVTDPEVRCAQASERSAVCWAQTCRKSPVDIHPALTARSQPPVAAAEMVGYAPAGHLKVSPSMYTLDAVGDFGHLLVNGRVFQADKVSIKAMSQHTFNGSRYAGELVVQHSMFGDDLNDNDSPAAGTHRRLEDEGHGDEGNSSSVIRVMLSVPLKLGRTSTLLSSLGMAGEAHKRAIRDGNSYDVIGPVDLRAALEATMSKSWYWYSGGPTTPGVCPAWGVKWIVFEEPLEVSFEQLNFLALPVSGMDSTLTPRYLPAPIDYKLVAQAYVPEDGVEVGGCERETGDFNKHPSCWKTAYPLCGTGKSQSPINIDTALATSVGTESFLSKVSWKPISGLRLAHNGFHLGFESTQLGYVTLTMPQGFPKYYQITSAALRMPSEHLIDGKQFHAELQIMHKNQKTVLELEDSDVLITSFMFALGDESKLLKQLLPAHLPAAGEYVPIEKPVDIMWALGPSLDGPFYKYSGSQTTPSCAEVVQWAVFETPMTLSVEQWRAFKTAFPNPGNNRPVQPLNGRRIVKNMMMEEAQPLDNDFFLGRDTGHDRYEPAPGLIIFPIIATLALCSVVMTALFQREDARVMEGSAGGLVEETATMIGRESKGV